MSKTLILGLALALVLVSGMLVNAQAECAFGCLPHISFPSCWFGSCAQPARDMDRPDATCQGAYQYGPTLPWYQLGGVGVGGG